MNMIHISFPYAFAHMVILYDVRILQWTISEGIMTISLCCSAISDTCLAMQEWVENPHAESALSNILPCVDQKTTNHTLVQSKQVINDMVTVVNQFIYTYANTYPSKDNQYYYNQSGPMMPALCYPFDSELRDRQCGPQEVSIANASWVRSSSVPLFSDLIFF